LPTQALAAAGRSHFSRFFLVVGLVVLLMVVCGGLLLYGPIFSYSASSPSLSPATLAAEDYENAIARQGIMLGFDAAHTHWNPYEKVINASNVSRLKPSWTYFFGDIVDTSPTVANGVIYVGSRNSNFYALDARCRHYCSPLWAYTAGYSIDSTAAVANGMGYVGSEDRKLYAFDARCRRDCLPLWTYTTGGPIYSSPTVANGMVYVGSYDHKLYAFDVQCRQACQPLWSYATGDQILASAAVADGMVYIGSGDHNLYAFDARCRHASPSGPMQLAGMNFFPHQP
jgi:outer membrane protein assembly factor BamB